MRRFADNDFPTLLELLYDAALDPSRWQAFLDALMHGFGDARGVLHLFDAGETTTTMLGFGHEPAFAESYAAHYGRVNPYPAVGFQRLRMGKVDYASNLFPTGSIEKSEFFNDWMRPQGITTDHLALLLRNDGRGMALLAVAPHASIFGKNRERYTAQLQMLAPHIVRAVEINRVTSAARLAEQTLGGTIEGIGVAAFLVGRSGRLLIANGHAEILMRTDRVVAVDRFKMLRGVCADDDRTLSAAIATCAGAATRSRQPIRLTSHVSGRTMVGWVLPIRPPGDDRPSRRFELFSSEGAEPMALLLLAPAESRVAIPPAAIQAAFGLSRAEARLASALAAGRTMTEYAKDAGLSRNTARNQLASAFAKTATTRQTQLVALIVGALGQAKSTYGG